MPNWGRFSASTTYNKTNATKRFSANVSTMVAGLLFCVVMTGRRRSGMGTRRGMQPFLWLRWVEVSPKRFSLPSLLTHSDRCTCPFGQMAKFCLILLCSHRRERDGRGDAHDRTFFAKNLQVIPVVSLSAAALVAVPNSQYGNPYMSIFFCDCNPRPMCGRR